MSTPKRLIVCLDGTWNRQDSSTNVLHHFNLVHQGLDPDTGWCQEKYYHPGVGTNSLDSITGGGFGFGLEENVRDAYNWLVANYCDSDSDNPDEIFVFGFSRGAYTARSLVGFIGECGLLRRGAPITVNELWEAYCVLGRVREKRTSIWERFFPKEPAPVRAITALATDPWTAAKYGAAPWLAEDPNPVEELLIRWSRRVKITYLGLYDTVGAIGWDALAIPGLTSRLALHNNMRPTTIIQQCRHALAIDEHRSSFNHTPFMSFIGLGTADSEGVRGFDDHPTFLNQDRSADADKVKWERSRAMWQRKIEQRWFVGAHSNVGGGYDANRLAELPLQWIFEGATKLNLNVESVSWDPPPTPDNQRPRDSFAEFAAPFWTKIFRAKRNYRVIDPDPIRNASPIEEGNYRIGFSLESINEVVDESVFAYWEKAKEMPPNLYAYAQRRGIETQAQPVHCWPGTRLSDFVAVILWATLAAAGLASVCQLIGLTITSEWHRWAAYTAAFILPFIDLSESRINFKRAMGAGSPGRQAFLDSIYWTRSVGFVLFLFGLINSVYYLGELGWHWNTLALVNVAKFYWPVPVLAAAALIVASKASKESWIALFLGPLAIFGAAAVDWLLFRLGGALFQAQIVSAVPVSSSVLFTAGLLLVLQLSLVYVWRAFLWLAEPMAQAHLDSVTKLQRCFTPKQVAACLNRWRNLLICCWQEDDPVTGPAARRMREIVRAALWRDIVGFIPVYAGFLTFGLWFGAYHTKLPALQFLKLPGSGFELWWLVPVATALADYLEDACHLRYLSLDEKGAHPSVLLTLFSSAVSVVKSAGFFGALVCTLAGIVAGTFEAASDLTDWRAKFAILMSSALLIPILLFVAGLLMQLASKPTKTQSGGIKKMSKAVGAD
jgi:uncharacterized protein (DUF2235 family)